MDHRTAFSQRLVMSGFAGGGAATDSAINSAAATLRALLGATEQARATLEALLVAERRAAAAAKRAAPESRLSPPPPTPLGGGGTRYGRAPVSHAAAPCELVDAPEAPAWARERAGVAARFRATVERMQSVGYHGALDAAGDWPSFVSVARELGRGVYGRAACVAPRFGDGSAPTAPASIALKRLTLVAAHDAAAVAGGGTTEARLRAEVAALRAVHARLAARLPPAEAAAASAHFPVVYACWPCAPRDAFIAMSLMPGPSLARALAAARRDDNRTRALLAAAVAPLYALDAAGIVHGDPHAENVVVAGRGTAESPFRAQLIDFGRARFVDGRRDDARPLESIAATPLFPPSSDAEAPPRELEAEDTGCVAQPGTNLVDFMVMLLWQQLLPPHAARAAFEAIFTAPAVERLHAELGAYAQGAPHPWGGPGNEALWHAYVEGARNNAAGLLAGTGAQTVRGASLYCKIASPHAAQRWLASLFVGGGDGNNESEGAPALQHTEKRARVEVQQDRIKS